MSQERKISIPCIQDPSKDCPPECQLYASNLLQYLEASRGSEANLREAIMDVRLQSKTVTNMNVALLNIGDPEFLGNCLNTPKH